MTNAEIESPYNYVDDDLRDIVRTYQLRNQHTVGPRPAEQEVSSWYQNMIRGRHDNNWLDEESRAAILARARVYYRSLTGQDITPETLRRLVDSGKSPEATTAPASVLPSPTSSIVSTPRVQRGSYYNAQMGRWCRGRDQQVKLVPCGPPELRKKATVKPQ